MRWWILCLMWAPGFAQNPTRPAWQNPAERYQTAHEAYLQAACPITPDDGMRHFVYVARDRARIHGHPAWRCDRFAGAQIMYPWSALEPEEGRYDFRIIGDDLAYLKAMGKKLFVQLQDTTFQIQNKAVPAYLQDARFDGGVVVQRDDAGAPEGWAAKRWNPAVQKRFAALLHALGEAFDGEIEGINLQETAIGVTAADDPSFSPARYAAAVRENMTALRAAFAQSVTLQYANFMPGEWLPWDDKGYLQGVYRHGAAIGVGIGAPDLMPKRKGQLNHALRLMHENPVQVPYAVAVQDGNYIGETNTLQVNTRRDNLVPFLHAFARDFLRVRYMFWADQPPYFEEDVQPCFSCN